MKETKLIQQLGEALRDAYQHLSYQGFGRACDSEIQPPSDLREKICSALDAWEAEPSPRLLRARVAGDSLRDLIEALQQLDPDLKHGVEEVWRDRTQCEGLGIDPVSFAARIDDLEENLSDEQDESYRLREVLKDIRDAKEDATVRSLRQLAREALE